MATQFDSGYTPLLGWSVSRYNMFQTCKRQYYYNYYAKYDQEFGYDRIDRLSNLTSIPLVKGNVVHDVIKTFFERLKKTRKEIDKTKFFKFARNKTVDYCNRLAFSEIYYDEISSIDVKEIFEDIYICLKNFLQSPRVKWLFNKATKYKEEWIVEPPNYGQTKIDEIKAYTKFDFLSPVEDKVVIIDWKTGRPDENKDRKQLLGYATWACYHLDEKPVNIKAILAYLKPDYSEVEISMDDYDFQSFYKQVKKETYEMRDYCKNAEKNIPKDKEVFMKTTNNKLCQYCNFRELCAEDNN